MATWEGLWPQSASFSFSQGSLDLPPYPQLEYVACFPESHFLSLHQLPASFNDKSVPIESNFTPWVLLWLSQSLSCLQVESSFCFGELFDLIFIVKYLQPKIYLNHV